MEQIKMKKERATNKWSQEYVAKKLGITKSAYSNIETLKRRPSYEVLIKLENLFNLSHRDLFQQVPDENILSEK
ncbi:transcriptional regulator with XRE-family HTH domain [Sedimentibacter acidaminivorans]|uniref:Transcriptional regulator with XRE-family HTH domain n=1 Tax=Sedimentibacter acidaminivorans TaxID=913099 RepID=A0ABS4GH85_9FIRM|nr:helix-turn-helix transcriptional regulator [Sedimentibacter acidaminivorans]MBP1927058.1 transcriptional regulator with XRE-family HTH domain [Sedimentibacter acidaminivorans]